VDESKRVASHLTNSIDYSNKNLEETDRLVNQELNEFQIEKIHYFDSRGVVVYSTLRDYIGTLNTRTYFHNIVAKGKIYYKVGSKGGQTSDGEKIVIDLIEIYVPVMKDGKFDSAFELYYDITEENKNFLILANDVTLVNILISNILGIIMFIMLYNASKNSLKKDELLRRNFDIQENLQDKTVELLATNGTLNSSISELARIQKQLLSSQKIANNARKNAEEANREKSMFLANISHELKTPLNGITGLIYLSKLKIKDKEVLINLSNIQEYSETLLRMISDLLDTSKMDAKKIVIENSVYNLKEMLESIKQLYKIQCDDKNIDFILNYDTHIPDKLVSDPVRLHQVITNLLNNAVKFTHDGAVRLTASIQSATENSVKIEFKVKDDGIGIKKEELKNIFKSFYQTEDSLSYYAGGSGLGLNISKKIVEHMDGIIWADSVLGKGSTFFVLVDFEIADDKKELLVVDNKQIKHNEELSDNASKKILVVDDNKINRDVLDGILKSVGITCEMAVNGLEALEMVKQNNYDIVLTDLKMPVMDGCELSKKIREMYDMNELPIITISANTKEETCQCLNKCNINASVQKPINPEHFLNQLASIIDLSVQKKTEKFHEITKINPILDIKSALGRFVNNEMLYKSTLKSFLIDYDKSFITIKSLIEEEKIKELIDYLHTIKGISGNLSATKFCDVTTKLHDTVLYGKSYDALLINYDDELKQLKEEIISYISDTKEESSGSNDDVLSAFDEEEKDEILLTLLAYCKEHNTKAISFFKDLPIGIHQDVLLTQLEHDILNYNFKKAHEKIERYFDEKKQ